MKRVHVRKQVPGEELVDALVPVPVGHDRQPVSPGPFARAAAAVTS